MIVIFLHRDSGPKRSLASYSQCPRVGSAFGNFTNKNSIGRASAILCSPSIISTPCPLCSSFPGVILFPFIPLHCVSFIFFRITLNDSLHHVALHLPPNQKNFTIYNNTNRNITSRDPPHPRPHFLIPRYLHYPPLRCPRLPTMVFSQPTQALQDHRLWRRLDENTGTPVLSTVTWCWTTGVYVGAGQHDAQQEPNV